MPKPAAQEQSEELEIQSLQKGQDRLLSVARETLRSVDLTNMLMVAATVLMAIVATCSAWTSWRIARLTQDFYATSNRPYLGVASIRFDKSNRQRPTSWVEFRNFGTMPAEQSVIDVASEVDGKITADPLGHEHVILSLGVISPNSPYYFASIIPSQHLEAVASGASKLVVLVEATYKDLDAHDHCYRMRYAYVSMLDKYDPDGGISTCNSAMPSYSKQTTWDKVVGKQSF